MVVASGGCGYTCIQERGPAVARTGLVMWLEEKSRRSEDGACFLWPLLCLDARVSLDEPLAPPVCGNLANVVRKLFMELVGMCAGGSTRVPLVSGRACEASSEWRGGTA